jgi:dihydrofolate reductase
VLGQLYDTAHREDVTDEQERVGDAAIDENAAMGKVIFLMNVSLDGYIETRDHSLDWTIVDDELHTWFNDRLRATEVSVYGRRLFEVMNAYWPTAESDTAATGPMLEFGLIWNAKPKVVVSSTMQQAPAGWGLTKGEPEAILEELRRDFSGDLEIGGPTLAAGFIRRGLVDEYQLVVHPVILGGGTPFFPDLERPAGLRLLETRTFSSGAVYLGFAAR